MTQLTLANLKLLVGGELEDGAVRIAGGRVEGVGSRAGSGVRAGSGREVDCRGLTALPAMVDNHVHFREPGAEDKEDFASGSAAAAHGGTATVLEVQNSLPLLTTPELVRAKKGIIARKACINVGLYASAARETLDHIDEVAAETVGLKLFMAPSHGDEGEEGEEAMRPYFSQCARLGWHLIVHAEDALVIREAAKSVSADRPEDFSRARPPAAEIRAVERALNLAREYGTRLHVFHVTTAGAVDLIAAAKKDDVDVTASTCPHYLFFTDADVKEKGGLLKVNPSIKAAHDRKRLFEGLREGVIEIVSTDHAPHKPEEKALPFARSPAGISSSDLFLPLMTTLVARGELTLDETVSLCSRNPARIHGLMTAGAIREGWPADIVLVDLDARWTVARDDFLSRANHSPYEGMELQGRVIATLVNGKPVYADRAGAPNLG